MLLHHTKHHNAYVQGANKALGMLESARQEGREIDMKAVLRDLSFNLNGHLLHELYWENMKEYSEENKINTELLEILTKHFNSYDNFQREFETAAKTVEGSGWVVLFKDKEGNLFINQVQNHNLLGIIGFKPILVNDVWEHAYYLDYKNERGEYVERWWDVVNWSVVLDRLKV